MKRFVPFAAAFHGFAAVALGAFGAHGLRDRFEAAADGVKRLEWWHTASHYELVHAVALLALAGLVTRSERPTRSLAVAAFGFAVGALVFSGTLYAMALGAPRWFGAITPFGGVLLLTGWGALGVFAARR